VIELACFATDGEEQMPDVYVEARPKGRPEGGTIEDFVMVEDHADHVLARFLTQQEAVAVQIGRARAAPERQTGPDQWRTA
jgi:hypothetical protein